MKLKNKYSKQNIYSNQKFEDQIWYNQQIMIFLNFSQLPESVFFALIFQENTFLETKPNFPLTGKCFPLTNFSNDKQTNESLESCFPETTFQKTNSAKAMFVSWKVVSGKSLSKLSCVCLPLGKLVNGKHFPVNREHFPVNGNTFRSTENTFQSKEKFGLVFRKVFSFLAVFVFRKVVYGKSLSKLFCVCFPLEKLVNGKHFPVKGKFGLVFRKVFSWKIWPENTFRKLWKI